MQSHWEILGVDDVVTAVCHGITVSRIGYDLERWVCLLGSMGVDFETIANVEVASGGRGREGD